MNVDDLLEILIQAPSVNPALTGAEEFSDSLGEGPVAEEIISILEKAGIAYQKVPVSQDRYNVVAHIPRGAKADEKAILLSGHMDTYPPEKPGDGAFDAIRQDGLMYGRGSADTKGSIASMLHAFVEVSQSDHVRECYFVASVDEEFGLTGAMATGDMDFKVDLAITGEPTCFEIVTCQKGILRFHVRLTGAPCHGAYPDIGASAPMAVATFVRAIDDLNRDVLSTETHPLLGTMKVTPTQILDKFSHMNLSHEFIDVNLDVRLNPGSTAASVSKLLDDYLTQHTDLKFSIHDPYFYSPPNEADRSNVLVQELAATVEREAGTCILGHFQYGSEAGYLKNVASAAIVFGPGDPKFSHAVGECIPIADLMTASTIYQNLLTSE